MEIDEVLAANAWSENGQRYLWSAPDELSDAVRGLGAAGLSAVRDGNPDKAIELTPLTWHKRLVG